MDEALAEDTVFTVKQSKVVNLIAGSVFALMLISVLSFDASGSSLYYALMIAAVPAVIFFKNAFDNTAAITINKDGIYFFGNLVTGWNSFKGARAKQLTIQTPGKYNANSSDRVVLIVEYYKMPSGDIYKQTIPLLSTQDKSESDIIEAIEFFYKLSQKKHDETKDCKYG